MMTTNRGKSKDFEQVIRGFFSELSSFGIEYCVLRNYRGLPKENCGSDIDMLFRVKDLKHLHYIFELISNRFDIKIFLVEKHNHGIRLFLYKATPLVFIKLDIHVDESWRGAVYFSADEILNNRKLQDCFYIPDPAHESVILLLSSLLAGGVVREKYIGQIRGAILHNQTDFSQCMNKIVGNRYSVYICEDLVSGNIERIESRVTSIRRRLWLQGLRRRGLGQIVELARYLIHQLNRRISLKGALLQVFVEQGSESAFDDFHSYMDGRFSRKFPGLQVCVVNRQPRQAAWKYRYNKYKAMLAYDVVLTKRLACHDGSFVNGIHGKKLLLHSSNCLLTEGTIQYLTLESSWNVFVDGYADKLISRLPQY